jgi:arylsulfatase A-like enzyme
VGSIISTASTRRGFLAAGAGALAALTEARAARRRPNFVILFADDMGYGDLACYGHPNIRTPNLDRMAAEGARFTSFYAAAPVCTPSRVGILTGRYPARAGLPNNLGPNSKGGLPLSEILLPQLLKPLGYKTMAIGKWHIGHNPKEYLPTARGFDHFLGLPYSNDMIPPWVKTDAPLRLIRDGEPVETVTDQSGLTELYTREALSFIRSAGSNPFFLYLPYSMPHLPVSTGARFRGRSRAGLYGDVIETIDWSVGEILALLKKQGVDGDTMVLFASDNGPWHNLPKRMLQKGVEPWHTGVKGLLRGAKGTTYEGGPRVPGIFRWPGVVAPRQTISDMASTLDVLPTIAAAAGAKLPTDRVYDGFDLMGVLRGQAKSPRTTYHYYRGAVLEAIREGSWKFRYARQPVSEDEAKAAEAIPPRPELYNLDYDPAEQYDVYERHREIGDRLREKMRAFAAELKTKTLL